MEIAGNYLYPLHLISILGRRRWTFPDVAMIVRRNTVVELVAAPMRQRKGVVALTHACQRL